MESNGYKPKRFRYRKDVSYTKLNIKDNMEKNETFALYVDVLINSHPPRLNDLYPNCFFLSKCSFITIHQLTCYDVSCAEIRTPKQKQA
jgi:hypothetical protein